MNTIIDSFRLYDEIISDIDKKHSKYLKNAVERAKFLLLNTNNTEGKISTILQYIADYCNQEEQDNLSEDVSNDICAIFNIFPQGFIGNESFKTVAISRKITDIEDVFEPLYITEEERELRKIAISEKNKNRFSKKNVEQYVNALLNDKQSISASDVSIETRRDLLRIIFISLYGRSDQTKYNVIPKDNVISSHGFRFRDFEIKRKCK